MEMVCCSYRGIHSQIITSCPNASFRSILDHECMRELAELGIQTCQPPRIGRGNPRIPCIPRIHSHIQNLPRLLQPGFFCKERRFFPASSSQKWMQSVAMMRSFLATSVIELFHDSNVACHHGDTLTGQAGMETADESEAS